MADTILTVVYLLLVLTSIIEVSSSKQNPPRISFLGHLDLDISLDTCAVRL